MEKKKVYRVFYFFDGKGHVDIEADNKEEAEDKFYEGDFEDENDEGTNYELDRIEGEEDFPF